jgi:putative ABC transport system substrate-binding protein
LLGLIVHGVRLENPPYDFEAAFEAMVEARTDMVLAASSPFFTSARSRIAELAIRHRLPSMFIFKTYVEAGGLLSYGTHIEKSYRRAALYVAKILNGASPADLPVEQPATFELAVNLKTARALGVTLTPAILLHADEVIE